MAQTRAVMPSKFLPLADELLEVTGVNDYSTLISVLLSRYGEHLKQTWNMANLAPSPQPVTDHFVAPPTDNFSVTTEPPVLTGF
jgi:hypothetical protein